MSSSCFSGVHSPVGANIIANDARLWSSDKQPSKSQWFNTNQHLFCVCTSQPRKIQQEARFGGGHRRVVATGWPWHLETPHPLPCPRNIRFTYCSHAKPFEGHGLERVKCWDHLDRICDRTPLRLPYKLFRSWQVEIYLPSSHPRQAS